MPAATSKAPTAVNKWLTGSLTKDIDQMVAAGFDEAERRDSTHPRTWLVLVDGNRTQIDAVAAEAAHRGVQVAVLIDLIHVLEYLWGAAWSFFDKAEPAAEEWVHRPSPQDPPRAGPAGRRRHPPPRHPLRLHQPRT